VVEHTLTREAPALAIDVAVGLVGFGVSFAWGRRSGREMDRDTVLFLAKMWGGIALFGMVMAFIM
jgi:hypothetical protein